MKYLLPIAIASYFLLCSSCSEDDKCYTCTLNSTVVDVCTDNYEEQAARDNVDVDSVDEYVDLVRSSGFDCVLNP